MGRSCPTVALAGACAARVFLFGRSATRVLHMKSLLIYAMVASCLDTIDLIIDCNNLMKV